MPPRLELTWIGKENRPRLEPRILLEDPSKSCHARRRTGEKDIFDNRLIFGDNLLALKALEQEFSGRVKCVYIDPPYNTGSAFEHYDDGIEHSIWLGLMRDRLELLCRLLKNDGSIWISIDDNECDYLKIVCDEIFGRNNFIARISWHRNYASTNDAKTFAKVIDYILVYQKTSYFKRNLLPRTEKQDSLYKYNSNDGKGLWRSDNLSVKTYSKNYDYPITNPNTGISYNPPTGRCWMSNEDTIKKWIKEGRIFFGQKGDGAPQLKRYLNEVQDGVVPISYWSYDDVGHNDEARKEIKALFNESLFSTPKPERLIQRIIHIATNPGDLVLDSFAGSGTTGAVAHKMGRRWIMVELGEHCHTHIIPRLKKVIDGEDAGGVTEAAGWKGGGGFRYYRLAPSLLQKDKWGNWIINKEYNAPMLAEAVCKLEGFTYAPSDSVYWIHGRSTENDFIYVTTAHLTHEHLALLSEEVGNGRTLLVMCTAFRSRSGGFPNLTIKKIPNTVLAKCEWGQDDYSLQIENLPMAQKPVKDQRELFEEGSAN